MKQFLVNTFLGRAALSLRDLTSLVRAAYSQPEIMGTLANDHLARILVTRLCSQKKIFVDVGAHIGSIISEVTYHCPSVRIVAVEAVPEKAASLRRLFPQVELHSCAVGDSEGEATFFVNTHNPGFSSLRRSSKTPPSQTREIRVPLRQLDGIISSDQVDVLKIDVEGAELVVLRGSSRLIADSRPTILFESGPRALEAGENGAEGLWQWFAQREYALLVPNRVAHNDPGLPRESFLESHLHPRRATNYFAIARERRAEIRDRARALLKIRAS